MQRAEVGATEGVAWQLLQHILAAADAIDAGRSKPPRTALGALAWLFQPHHASEALLLFVK